jgi:hypothetical protein
MWPVKFRVWEMETSTAASKMDRYEAMVGWWLAGETEGAKWKGCLNDTSSTTNVALSLPALNPTIGVE